AGQGDLPDLTRCHGQRLGRAGEVAQLCLNRGRASLRRGGMANSNTAPPPGQGFGYNPITHPECKPGPADTFHCGPSNTTGFIERKDPSRWCSCCDRQTCGRPQCRNCIPFMKKIEAMEAAARSRMLLWRSADNV